MTHGGATSTPVLTTPAGPWSLEDLCPGIQSVTMHNSPNVSVLQMTQPNCTEPYAWPPFTAQQGAIYGICSDSASFCKLHVRVPKDMHLRLHIQRLEYWCSSSDWESRVSTHVAHMAWFKGHGVIQCGHHSLMNMYFDLFEHHVALIHRNRPKITVQFKAITHLSFIKKTISEMSGYVVAPFGHDTFYESFTEEIRASPGYVTVVSFQQAMRFSIKNKLFGCDINTKLIYKKHGTSCKYVLKFCSVYDDHAQVILSPYILLQRQVGTESDFAYKVYFSLLPLSEQPRKLPSGLLNCTVHYYSKFQDHLDCNLKVECGCGRDETQHCPFSSPACHGLVASHNKCFRLLINKADYFLSSIARYECVKANGKLATIKTRKEQEDVLHIFKHVHDFKVLVGLSWGWHSTPFLYSKFRKWDDGTLIYELKHFAFKPFNPSRRHHNVQLQSMVLPFGKKNPLDLLLCELQPHKETMLFQKLKVSYSNSLQPAPKQTRQHMYGDRQEKMTHFFLFCELDRCFQGDEFQFLSRKENDHEKNQTLCACFKHSKHTSTMFWCGISKRTIHYTLVCDFRHNCPDKSDEEFCDYPSCNGFVCSNGQCVLYSQRCNEYSDCLDHSDEINCHSDNSYLRLAENKYTTLRSFVNLDGTGYFYQQQMESSQRCPSTHYSCPSEHLYCLPAYTRCNGLSDCVYGEDELDCEDVRCTGLYWCKASNVCVHGDHLCDGWSQCPDGDDEFMCDADCPAGCLCEGYAFLCDRQFPVFHFPQLRYLDGTGSDTLLSDLSQNMFLIYIDLSNCSVTNVSWIRLPNLQFLSLKNNQMKTLSMLDVYHFFNLRVLILADNPMKMKPGLVQKYVHYSMESIDMSQTSLGMLQNQLHIYFPKVKKLNLSFSALKVIKGAVFRDLPNLSELDIRGNLIIEFPFYFLQQLRNLKVVLSSNYRFCCRNLLSQHSSDLQCVAPQPLMSMCSNILPSDMHTVFFGLLASFAVLGNLLFFIVSLFIQDLFGSTFLLLNTHLHFLNMCSGIHISIISVANELFYENFLQFEKTWTHSLACKLAGFLCLLSNEMSLLIIFSITLYLIIALNFPMTTLKLKRQLIGVMCALAWVVGMIIVLSHFVHALSYWSLDYQSGLCHLTFFTHHDIEHAFNWSTFTVTFNFTLCLAVLIGHATIYWQIPKTLTGVDSSQRPVLLSAVFVRKVAIITGVTWFPLGLLTVTGWSNTDRTRDAIAVYVLPLSPALTPLLLGWTVISQRRKLSSEQKLLQLLKSQFVDLKKTQAGM